MYFEDFNEGLTVTIPPVAIEKERLTAFARLYDPIPLHLDEEYAKTTIFGGLIAPGAMSFLTLWGKYLEQDLCGPETIAGKSSKTEWFKPVYPGDRLHATLTVTALTPRNRKNGIVEFSMEAFNQEGTLVLTNVTEVIVKRRTE